MEPQFIPVTKKKKIARVQKPEDNNQEGWPDALKDYVANAFALCTSGKETLLGAQLTTIVGQANRTNMLDEIDWDARELPSACKTTKNPKARIQKSSFAKTINSTASTSAADVKKIKPSQIEEVKLTPEELRKRSERAKRFNTDIPLLPANKRVKKENSNYTPIVWDLDSEPVEEHKVIIGTSTALEKPYFRLTSAADPATVRPLPILRKAFKFLSKKWRKDGNYSYICEQFKSMRQDLTVQRITNEFTARVYEAHARIALEKGDIGEYNQCQTQLKYLYQKGIKGSSDEFLAYRILYMIFSQNQSDINSMLEEMCDISLENHASCVQHALMVRSSLAKRNYYKFFKLYENAPNMGGYLMDQFVGRERVEALITACKAYKMGVSLSYLVEELSFDNISQIIKFLREHGVTQILGKHDDRTLDTKAALPILMSQSKNYSKVDIKGQI